MINFLRSDADISGQFDLSAQTIARILILSYFVGLSFGFIGGTDLTLLAQPFLPIEYARILMATLVVILCVMALFDWRRRTAAMTLALILFWSSYMTMFQLQVVEVDFFWRDLALIGGLLFSAGFGETMLNNDDGEYGQDGDDGIVEISRPSAQFNDPHDPDEQGKALSARQVRKDLDLVQFG